MSYINISEGQFEYLDYHCDCLPPKWRIQYPFYINYKLPLKCMTCMKMARVRTAEVVAENTILREKRLQAMKSDSNLFKNFKIK